MAEPENPDPSRNGEEASVAAAPNEPDAIDPELVRLPHAQPRRSPVVSIAVMAVSALVLVQLRGDLGYALSSASPVELTATSVGDSWPDNRLVAIAGIPDHRNALAFEPKGDSYRRSFFRLLGTGDRVLVRADETSTRADLSERFVGRLRRFEDISFAGDVRRYYGDLQVTRFCDLAALQRALAQPHAGNVKLLDGAGAPFEVDASKPVAWTLDFPDEIKVSLSRDKFAVEEDARHEVERLGQPIVGKAVDTHDSYVYVITLPVEPAAKRNAYVASLEERHIGFAVHREIVTASFAQASVEGDALTLAGVKYPFANVRSAQLAAPLDIPTHGAWMLLEGELPAELRWAPLVAGVLALFLLLNVFLLARALRRK